MSFWDLAADASKVALISGSAGDLLPSEIAYAELGALADGFGDQLRAGVAKGSLGFLLSRNDATSVCVFLGALRGGHCLALLSAAISQRQLAALATRYRPEWVFAPGAIDLPGYTVAKWLSGCLYLRQQFDAVPVHPNTALLLTTSGSTGSPKMVRLSYVALDHNATSIAKYLNLGDGERAITSLSISYSYGLSVLNSHLAAGAATILTENAVVSRPFWDAFRKYGATSMAGVPYTYQMLQRLDLRKLNVPSLRTLTQAGGHLPEPLKRETLEIADARGWRFYVMYGQTEAAPRIAYVPPSRLWEKLGSIGIAIPGGKLAIDPGNGELIYRGPNVMMGYADGREDLAQGDLLHGTLRTGDLAREDDEGYFYITGRGKRIAKLYGNRVNLDEVETFLEARFGESMFAALDGGTRIVLISEQDRIREAVVLALRDDLRIPPSALHFVCGKVLLTNVGKKDIRAMEVAYLRDGSE